MKLLQQLLYPFGHSEKTVWHLCKITHTKATYEGLRQSLRQHPNYPSITTISDILHAWKIDNVGIQITAQQLHKLEAPFLAEINAQNPVLAVVEKISSQQITFYNPLTNKTITQSIDEFNNIYIGTSLAIDASNAKGEDDYKQKQKKENVQQGWYSFVAISIPLLLVFSFLYLFLNNSLNIGGLLYGLLTLLGVITSAILIWHQIDEYNPTIRQICQASKKVNCSAILNSPAAKIAGLSWSSIGFAYFLGLLLLQLTLNQQPASLFVMACLSSLSVPYTIFSIYYQYKIAKQWCVLCLAIQALLLLQFILIFVGNFYSYSFSFTVLLPTITCFVIAFCFIILLMPALEKAKQSHMYITAFQKLKHNAQIFEALLLRQKTIAYKDIEHLGITEGNINGSYIVVKVCNPYCGPCAKAHPAMQQLLQQNDNMVLKIIFTASEADDDYRGLPVRLLMAIAAQHNANITAQALDSWYNSPEKNYEKFAQQYKQYLPQVTPQLINQLKAMLEWCEQVRIEFTPTFFIGLPTENGTAPTTLYQLPDNYNIEDVKYFLSI